MKKTLLISLLFFVSSSTFATPSPNSGFYEGTVQDAKGNTRDLNGVACNVDISYTDIGLMNISVSVNNKRFSSDNLAPKLGGSNLYEPKWLPEIIEDDSLVVYVHPTLPEALTLISISKTNLSQMGYEYSFKCEIQEIDWDLVQENFSAGYNF